MYDSFIADRCIFGKGIFFVVISLVFSSMFCISLFTISPIFFFFIFHQILKQLLRLFTAAHIYGLLNQRSDFFFFTLFTVFNSLFIFYSYLFILINTELAL